MSATARQPLARPARPIGPPATGAGSPAVVAALVLFGIVILATVGGWWLTTGPVTTWTEAITETGRLTGLGASVAMVALVTLSARIGPLDRALGSERLYRWHGRFGRYTVWLILAHLVLILAGYALMAHASIIATAASFLTDDNLVLSLLATLALVVVGLASALAVRRHLPYEVWHLIHLTTYAAILLGLFHQITLGAQFIGRPVASAVWVLAIVIPVVILLVNRLIRPLIMNSRHRFFLKAVTLEPAGLYSLTIGGTALAQIPVRAGQYIRVHANAPGLRLASNPYSLSALPTVGGWRITLAAVGQQSRRLVKLRPGTRLWLEGPLGGLTLGNDRTRPVVLIAGGSGITPIRALAEAALIERPTVPVTVIYRVRRVADALFRAEWAELTAKTNGRLTVHLLAGSRTAVANRLTPARLRALAPWIGQSEVHICAAAGLVTAVKDAVQTTGAASLRVESFGW